MKTWRGEPARKARRSNSLAVVSTSRSDTLISRAMVSMARSPNSRVAVCAVAAGCAAPAQDRAHPGGQLGRGEGLHHVVVGTELEPEDPVGLVALGRDQDDGDVARAADGGQDVEAVLGGEHDVEDHEVGLAVAQAADRLGPGRSPR